MIDLRDLLKRIRQWDAMDIPDSDGAYWKREIDAALEQPEQEPVAINCQAKRDNGGVCPHHNLQCGWPNCNKPQRIKQEQQEQEPVAWMYKGIKSDGTEHGPHLVWAPAYMDAMSAAKGVVASPLYPHPPRREWRGLSEEEIKGYKLCGLVRDVEAKLKEKNHD
jgi:hypothetical protein